MDRARVYRLLRMAVSAACLIVCVLLVALWLRSHWTCDYVLHEDSSGLMTAVGSNRGTVYFARMPRSLNRYGSSVPSPGWKVLKAEATQLTRMFEWRFSADRTWVRIPNFVLIILWAAIGSLPWLPWTWRFSLRTLLIVMTLFSVGLGTVIYLFG